MTYKLAVHTDTALRSRKAPATYARIELRNIVHVEKRYPGGSKKRVTRAGEAIRSGTATHDDIAVIEEWRAAHRGVLNTFQAILRFRTKGKKVTVAQRHKRRNTIFNKLQRLPGMQLARMDDVAGCRVIFRNIKELDVFRSNFHRARFNHKLRNDPDKYNYIKNPKPTGYRGIHDVYEYDVRSEAGKDLAGLYIEIQYRTLVQHAWATGSMPFRVELDNIKGIGVSGRPLAASRVAGG